MMATYTGKEIKEVFIYRISGGVLLRTTGAGFKWMTVSTEDCICNVDIEFRNGAIQHFYNVTVFITENPINNAD